MIVGSDDEVIISEGNIAVFSLSTMISPGIKPLLKLINKGFTWLKSEVIKNYILMTLVAAPPLVIFFEVSIRVLFPDSLGLACSSISIMPLNVLRSGARGDFDIILLDFTDVSVMSKKNIWGNLGFSTSFGVFENFFPVGLRVTLNGKCTELPRSFYTCILLHAVG